MKTLTHEMPRLEVHGTQVEYLEQGRGETVVLLHSSASSSAQWRELIGRLSERYRVIAPDLHGYGRSSAWTGRGPFRLEHEANIVAALIGRAGAPAHLVGHSFGGAVALHVARTRPDLLSSLTVIEPVAFHLLRQHDVVSLVQIMAVANSVANALACGDYFAGMERFVDYWSGPGAWQAIPADKRAGLAARLAKVALDFEATLNEPATLAQFRDVAVPTLVMHGTQSPCPTRSICRLLMQALPDAESAAIEGAGHMAPLTHRDRVNDLIATRLKALDTLAA
jgi:pimeloyl-ACP methyl ester carboxylesterase